MHRVLALLLTTFILTLPASTFAQPLDWPTLYDTSITPDLNVKLQQSDWNLILNDTTFDIEVPALFWAAQDGFESAILVSIRRKSATPINGKVSFKIDINEYNGDDPRAVSKWHNVKKLSLENGDDMDVVSEGLAWYIHSLAQNENIYPQAHHPGMANWASLTVHLANNCVEPCGAFDMGDTKTVLEPMIYLSVEQPDKQFLKNRNQWFSEETWLYKQDSASLIPEIKEAGCDPESDNSPIFNALTCTPFVQGSKTKGRKKSTLESCDLALVNDLIDMRLMLAQGAVDAFTGSPDSLFSHEKNFYIVDYASEGTCTDLPGVADDLNRQKRLHFSWDLDSAISNVNQNIYGKLSKHRGKLQLNQTGYQEQLLINDPYQGVFFRTQYNENLLRLTDLTVIQKAQQFLTDVEPILTPLLLADPNSKINNPTAHFNSLRTWLSNRAGIVRGQVCADDTSLPGCN